MMCQSRMIWIGVACAALVAAQLVAEQRPASSRGDGDSTETTSKKSVPNGANEARFRGMPTSWWHARLKHEPRDAKVRLEAIKALGTIGAEAAVAIPELIAAMEDSELEIRVAAIEALGSVGKGSKSAAAALLVAVDDSDRWYRMRAMRSLRGVGVVNQSIVDALCRQLADASAEDSEASGRYQRETNRECALETLKALGPEAVRAAKPALMKSMEPKEDVVILDPNWNGAVVDVVAVAGKDAVPDLLSIYATGGSNMIGARAARALEKLGADAIDATPRLLELYVDEAAAFNNKDTTASILAAIGKSSQPAAEKIVPVMVAELAAPSMKWRRRAAIALREMAPHAGSATSALEQAVADLGDDARLMIWIEEIDHLALSENEDRESLGPFRERYEREFKDALETIRVAEQQNSARK